MGGGGTGTFGRLSWTGELDIRMGDGGIWTGDWDANTWDWAGIGEGLCCDPFSALPILLSSCVADEVPPWDGMTVGDHMCPDIPHLLGTQSDKAHAAERYAEKLSTGLAHPDFVDPGRVDHSYGGGPKTFRKKELSWPQPKVERSHIGLAHSGRRILGLLD